MIPEVRADPRSTPVWIAMADTRKGHRSPRLQKAESRLEIIEDCLPTRRKD